MIKNIFATENFKYGVALSAAILAGTSFLMSACSEESNAVADVTSSQELSATTETDGDVAFGDNLNNVAMAVRTPALPTEPPELNIKCSNGMIFNKNTGKCERITLKACGDQWYNSASGTQKCVNGVVYGLCGSKWFNSETSFCYSDSIYAKCNGQTYDPATEKCMSGASVMPICNTSAVTKKTEQCVAFRCTGTKIKVCREYIEDLCGGKTIDLSTQFCSSYTIYDKCNGVKYNPEKKFCDNNQLYDKCGNSAYDVENEFCYEGDAYKKCNGVKYNPETQFCYDGSSVTALCGGKAYSADQFCYSNKVYDKCDGSEFDPTKYFCYDGSSVTALCNGKAYTASQFCDNGKVYDKCGGEIYDPNEQFCHQSSLLDLCGGKTYKPGIPDFDWNAFVNTYGFYGPYCEEVMRIAGEECVAGEILARCGCDGGYNKSRSFCARGRDGLYHVYPYCNGESYDPQVYYCQYNSLSVIAVF